MKNKALYIVVGVLTLGHLAVRTLSGGAAEPTPVVVSSLVPGERVESPALDHLLEEFPIDSDVAAAEPAGHADEASCRLVVAFDASCPFCNQAAESEAATDRPGAYGETLWITHEAGPRLPAFVDRLSDRANHAVSAEAYQALGVQGVPAAFLLAPDGELRWMGPYRGVETVESLADRCAPGADA